MRPAIWFAWYPVRLGSLGLGRRVWLRRVWRFRSKFATTSYQSIAS